MRILDRYVISKFAMPFMYCFLGFLAIWFIFDLADNLQDFMEGGASIALLRDYYLTQIPEIIVMSLPVATLLALLYSLTAMSRSNEIISMLGAGVSVVRVIAPLIVIGVLLAVVSAWFNYEDAPHAAALRKQILREIRHGELREENLSGHLFRNREEMRTWYVRKVWMGRGYLTSVTIIQQDEKHRVTDKWYVKRAEFNPATHQWIFHEVFHAEYDETGNEVRSLLEMEKVIDGWSETPWRISSSVMNPDFLSVRELEDYLYHNSDFPVARLAPYRTHWHYRWSLPTFAVVVVFLAAPMGIVYSRRGILGGVAVAVALFFSMVFLSSLSLAFGKGARLSPLLAAWLPTLVFFAIGCTLLWFRSTGRELPKIKMPWT
jgi:lipopolysaccharide export system permease protein